MDFNLIRPYANNNTIRMWHNTSDFFKIYAKMCTPMMWLKLNEKHTKFAEIIKKWLPNSDLYWCCIYCDEKIIQHKSVNCVTVEHIYVNPYILDKVFYDFRAKILRIRCPDCRSLLDDGTHEIK